MILHRIAFHRHLAVLLTVTLTASFTLSAVCNPAPIQQETPRVHAAAASLVLM